MQGFDLQTISNCYIGNTQASAIFFGANKIWPTTPQVQKISIPTTWSGGTHTFTNMLDASSLVISNNGNTGNINTIDTSIPFKVVSTDDNYSWHDTAIFAIEITGASSISYSITNNVSQNYFNPSGTHTTSALYYLSGDGISVSGSTVNSGSTVTGTESNLDPTKTYYLIVELDTDYHTSHVADHLYYTNSHPFDITVNLS